MLPIRYSIWRIWLWLNTSNMLMLDLFAFLKLGFLTSFLQSRSLKILSRTMSYSASSGKSSFKFSHSFNNSAGFINITLLRSKLNFSRKRRGRIVGSPHFFWLTSLSPISALLRGELFRHTVFALI